MSLSISLRLVHLFPFLFLLHISSLFFVVNAYPIPPCTLTFCALNGARALCAPSDPACNTNGLTQPLDTCMFHSPRPCSAWAYGPPTLSCNAACPTTCLPPEHRPVASDGVAYCSDCSFVHASCLSGFAIAGPVARGVDNAYSVQPPPSEVTGTTTDGSGTSTSSNGSNDGGNVVDSFDNSAVAPSPTASASASPSGVPSSSVSPPAPSPPLSSSPFPSSSPSTSPFPSSSVSPPAPSPSLSPSASSSASPFPSSSMSESVESESTFSGSSVLATTSNSPVPTATVIASAGLKPAASKVALPDIGNMLPLSVFALPSVTYMLMPTPSLSPTPPSPTPSPVSATDVNVNAPGTGTTTAEAQDDDDKQPLPTIGFNDTTSDMHMSGPPPLTIDFCLRSSSSTTEGDINNNVNNTTDEHTSLCCELYNLQCIPQGQACTTTTSTADAAVSTAKAPCERGTQCIDDVCTYVPRCSVEQCARHGMHLHCVNDHTNDTVTCADMSRTGAFNCVDNVDCDPACYDGFATRSFVASDGSAFCSPCALAVYSCMRGFEIWGPVEIA